ncbi:MAG TPA: tRNA-intron lyase [Thermofilum sp.]|nr:tRNA-intron lyase [Thermofilum sp.]
MVTLNEIITAYLLGNKVVVLDKKKSNKLYFGAFYGKFYDVSKPKVPNIERELELSYFDTLYLMEKGMLEVRNVEDRKLSFEELERIFSKHYENFKETYLVYKDLRERGFIVKSGMKFGTTFAVYKFGPGIDHAPFLVHVLPYGSRLDPIEIIRAGRLSHSVRKKFVIAYINSKTGEVNYFVFKWLM